MRVFVAGGTGAIGRKLVPALVAAGHEVVALTRNAGRSEWLRTVGATPVMGDALDRAGLRSLVAQARPDAVIHQMTDIPRALDPRHYGEQMAGNDRLRVDGTRNLVDAAVAAGARRIIAQSIAFAYAPGPRGACREDDPLWDDAPEPFRRSVAALRSLESAVLETPGIAGVVLRYGFLYGPGTAYAVDGHIADEVRARRFPVVGEGGGRSSFVHVEDAASAALRALEGERSGIYNVVDDEPAPLRDWLPVFAQALGAKPPLKVPAFVARIAVGALIVHFATDLPGASNARARSELGLRLQHPSWRVGLPASLSP